LSAAIEPAKTQFGELVSPGWHFQEAHRTHLSLNRNSPIKREVEQKGDVISIPQVGGLHHRYRRAA